MLRWRLTLGTALIAALALWCWVDFQVQPAGVVLFPLAVLLTVAASQEFVHLTSSAPPLDRGAIYGGNALVVISNGLLYVFPTPHEASRLLWPLAALGLAWLASLAATMRSYKQPGTATARLALVVLSLVYIGLQVSCWIQLRALGEPRVGFVALVSMIAVVKAGDTGAYTAGRLFGRHRMAPTISPGKTWEGAAGGLLLACAAAWLTLQVWMPTMVTATPPGGRWAWALYGVLVSAAGMFGDLAESLLKRDAGRKDSSTWMPGFGGVLDLVDSLLTGGPVALVLWLARDYIS